MARAVQVMILDAATSGMPLFVGAPKLDGGGEYVRIIRETGQPAVLEIRLRCQDLSVWLEA